MPGAGNRPTPEEYRRQYERAEAAEKKLAKVKAEIERRRDRLVTWRDQVKSLGDGEQARGYHQRSKEYDQMLHFIADLGKGEASDDT